MNGLLRSLFKCVHSTVQCLICNRLMKFLNAEWFKKNFLFTTGKSMWQNQITTVGIKESFTWSRRNYFDSCLIFKARFACWDINIRFAEVDMILERSQRTFHVSCCTNFTNERTVYFPYAEGWTPNMHFCLSKSTPRQYVNFTSCYILMTECTVNHLPTILVLSRPSESYRTTSAGSD